MLMETTHSEWASRMMTCAVCVGKGLRMRNGQLNGYTSAVNVGGGYACAMGFKGDYTYSIDDSGSLVCAMSLRVD